MPERCSYVLGAPCVSGSHEDVMECLVSSADTTAEVDSTRVEKLKMEAHNLGADGAGSKRNAKQANEVLLLLVAFTDHASQRKPWCLVHFFRHQYI